MDRVSRRVAGDAWSGSTRRGNSRTGRQLIELTHQLKGAAGLYGLESISQTAQAIHRRASEDADLAELHAVVRELAELTRRAVAGRSPPK